MALAQLAVEIFEAQRLATLRMGREVAHGRVEVPVIAQLEFEPCVSGHGAQALQHAPVARCGHDQPLGAKRRDRRAQRRCQIGRSVVLVEALVEQRPPGFTQGRGEVAHRGEEQRDARFR